MKNNKQKFFIIAGVFSILSLQCSKKDEASTNKIKSPFIVKYELIYDGKQSGIREANSSFANSVETTSYSTIKSYPWTNSITVTAENRPKTLFLTARIETSLSGPPLTGNIYINGVKKATLTESYYTANGYYYYNISMKYVVE